MRTLGVSCAAVLCLSLLAGLAASKKIDVSKLPPASAKTGVAYTADIKPVFEKRCFTCHGSEKQKGRLRLDSLEAALKGSEHGKVIRPNQSAQSKLVHVVAGLDPDETMPPQGKGDPLTRDQVGLIRAWIDQGAR